MGPVAPLSNHTGQGPSLDLANNSKSGSAWKQQSRALGCGLWAMSCGLQLWWWLWLQRHQDRDRARSCKAALGKLRSAAAVCQTGEEEPGFLLPSPRALQAQVAKRHLSAPCRFEQKESSYYTKGARTPAKHLTWSLFPQQVEEHEEAAPEAEDQGSTANLPSERPFFSLRNYSLSSVLRQWDSVPHP